MRNTDHNQKEDILKRKHVQFGVRLPSRHSSWQDWVGETFFTTIRGITSTSIARLPSCCLTSFLSLSISLDIASLIAIIRGFAFLSTCSPTPPQVSLIPGFFIIIWGGGGFSHMKGVGIFVTSLRGVNFGFLSQSVLGETPLYSSVKVPLRVAHEEVL